MFNNSLLIHYIHIFKHNIKETMQINLDLWAFFIP